MKKAEKELMEQYKIACDASTTLETEQRRLESKIDGFKNNPQYRALFDKKALERAETRLKEINITLEALGHYRHYLIGKEV
jgi:hypothetical protein